MLFSPSSCVKPLIAGLFLVAACICSDVPAFAQAPATSDPAAEPATTEPAATEPATTEPATTEPAATEAAATQAAASETRATTTTDTELKATPSPTAPASVSSNALQFNFAGAPWSEVLRWFAEQADLSLQMDTMPAGTVNFSDPNKLYTVSEGLDLINRLLLDRGWAVVRRGRMLLLVDLEADNAEKLISEMAELVTPDSFDERGNSDIVRCVFPLGAITPEQAREELSQVIGPWGRINVLAGARQVIVTETVGKLRVINEVLHAATEAQSNVVEIILQHRAADEVLEIARPLLGLEPGSNASDDIRLSVSLYGDRIFATGSQSKLDLLSSVIEKADREMPNAGQAADEKVASPELRTHPVASANLQTVYDVLQTMIAGTPEARLAMDANRGAIIAFGRPEMQDKIRNTIAELEGSGRDFTIIDLKRLEPAQALLTINKFFGVTESGGGNAPIVDGDPATGRLWVRGTADQVESVKRLIAELENDPLAGGLGENVRILPLTGSAANNTLKQIETLWPLTGRTNQIRIITPSSDRDDRSDPKDRSSEPRRFDSDEQPDLLDTNNSAATAFQTLVWQNSDTVAPEPTATPEPDYSGDDIIIQMTPAGLVIASRDQRALDMIEQLITSMGTEAANASTLPTIFWLRYIKADVAAEMVAGVLGGADASGSAGSLTESVVGGLGGGMLGGLLGMGGGGGGDDSETRTILTSRGSVNIVPDNRLNALIVQAPPSDMDFIRMVLKEIDLEESPETIQTVARPALIPVIYQDAAEVAKIVTAVFAEKVGDDKKGGEGGRGGQPNPQDIIKALRGGGGGGNQPKPKSEAAKIIVAVDARSNSLVVTAIPQDLQAIRDLVEILDEQGLESEEKVEVIAMGGSVRPEVMLQALQSVTGKTPTTATSSTTKSSSTTSTSSSSNSSGASSSSSPEAIQRRIEFFRSRFGGGGSSDRSGRGSSRGSGSGGSSRGGGRGR